VDQKEQKAEALVEARAKKEAAHAQMQKDKEE
jgi:hypothetical protein